MYAGYRYSAMSNLVTRADRRSFSRDDDATGEPNSLAGMVDVSQMGSRAHESSRSERPNMPESADEPVRKRRRTQRTPSHPSILASSQQLEGLVYKPSTSENRERLEGILVLIARLLDPSGPEVVRSAADFVIETFKTDPVEAHAKSQIDAALGLIVPDGEFAKLEQLVAKISDFSGEEADKLNTTIEDGVAVVLDEQTDSNDETAVEDDDADQSEADAVDDIDLAVGQRRSPTNDHLGHDGERLCLGGLSTAAIGLQDVTRQWFVDMLGPAIQPSAVEALMVSDLSDALVENELTELFDFERVDLTTFLMQNRQTIVWGLRLVDSSDRSAVVAQLKAAGLGQLLGHAQGVATELRDVKLDDIAFTEGSRLMSNKKVRLPEGSFKRTFASYEEIHVPAPAPGRNSQAPISIASLPEWARTAFPGMQQLNTIQSAIYAKAFSTDDNLLICAPTGAGKTNVAMLTILRILGKHLDQEQVGRISRGDFKIVYIAPLKALVSEMVGNFSQRLAAYGLTVAELTGDSQLNRQQLNDADLIVTTPEKWDIVTRKAVDGSYATLVRLVIIDEVHLLHDERGPVLEAIVARLRQEPDSWRTRLIGLSATLPNYLDVAKFLAVRDDGTFHFDSSYRPCPLQQTFIGVTEKKAIKRLQALNSICHEKVVAATHEGHQVLVFVHSRADTYRTAKFIRDRALESDDISSLLRSDAATREILKQEAENATDANLRDVLPFGVAIHHAGLSKSDRVTAEDLFSDGHVRVLVATATLAWGVNLPAHSVIIKGTQIYSPEKGSWVELSSQDVLQMLGRAGRPQYDTFGEGCIITSHSELQYYLSLLNQQLPIESQLVSRLADMLNAEIVRGSIASRAQAVGWLGHTYLYIRMLSNPSLYMVGPEYSDDKDLHRKCAEVVHAASKQLAAAKLIKYDVASGSLSQTDLGRVAAFYYISCDSMQRYNDALRADLNIIDLFRIFAQSTEFRYMPVRDDEKLELVKMVERAPIPVREGVDDPICKVNLLLQAYISRFKLDGFALLADMVYITQSAGRLLRAIFEICLRQGWSQATQLTLKACKMAERGLWITRSPIAQFPDCSRELLRKVERKEFPWSAYLELDPQELRELLGDAQSATRMHTIIQRFPRVEVQVNVQPITRSSIKVHLTITGQFEWDTSLHGAAESFWIFCEDCNGERVLHYEQLVIRQKRATEAHYVDMILPCFDPPQPQYYISVISDRWLHSECQIAVPLRDLILPAKFPPPSQLQGPRSAETAARLRQHASTFAGCEPYTKIEERACEILTNSNDSVLIAHPSQPFRPVLVEIALLQHFATSQHMAVYISPYEHQLRTLAARWTRTFKDKIVHRLVQNDVPRNIGLLRSADIILATPGQWEQLSRRWQQRKGLRRVETVIADHLHSVGTYDGAWYEIAMSRMRYIAAQLETHVRFVALTVPLADPRDMRDWLGIGKKAVLNLGPGARERPLEIQIRTSHQSTFSVYMASLNSDVRAEVSNLGKGDRAIVCVPHAELCMPFADNLVRQHASNSRLPADANRHLVQDETLLRLAISGVGLITEHTSALLSQLLQGLFVDGQLDTLVIAYDALYTIAPSCDLFIVAGTQHYDGAEHRYIDYPITDVSHMLSLASRPGELGKPARAVIMTINNKKDHYKKFAIEALPLESQLQSAFADDLLAELSGQVVESKQEAVDWLTWTFFYRRLAANPSFYGSLNSQHDTVSTFLSDLVEDSVQELVEGKLIDSAIEEHGVSLSLLELGLIATHYALSHLTVQTFALSFGPKTRLKGLLEIVCAATELDKMPLRRHEDVVLRKLATSSPVHIDYSYDDPHHKAFILLQAHFSRVKLPQNLQADLNALLVTMPRLLSAAVDVMSSQGLPNALSAIELCKMCTQAVWNWDSPLKQLPHIDEEALARLKIAGVADVAQIAELSDSDRDDLLRLPLPQLSDLAQFCNRYPDVELRIEDSGIESLQAGQPGAIRAHLERNVDEDEDVELDVIAPYFPDSQRQEGWWLVVMLGNARELLAIKRVSIRRRLTVDLPVTIPADVEDTQLDVSVLLLSDCYVGVDREYKVAMQVKIK